MANKINLADLANIQFGSGGDNNTSDGEATPSIIDLLAGYASLGQKNIVDDQFNIILGYISSMSAGLRLGTGAENKIFDDITDLNDLFQSGNYSYLEGGSSPSGGSITAPSNSPVVNQSYTLDVITRNEVDDNSLNRTAGAMFKLVTQTATVEEVKITRQGKFNGSSFVWSSWYIRDNEKFIIGFSYPYPKKVIASDGKTYCNTKETGVNLGIDPVIDSNIAAAESGTGPYNWFSTNWRREKKSVFFTGTTDTGETFYLDGYFTSKGSLLSESGEVYITAGSTFVNVQFANFKDQYNNTPTLISSDSIYSTNTNVDTLTTRQRPWNLRESHNGADATVNVITIGDLTSDRVKFFTLSTEINTANVRVMFSPVELYWTDLIIDAYD